VHQRQAEGQRRLQAADAEGGVVELAQLVLDGVGRVVGGDGVDGAVQQAAQAGLGVGGRAQGRVDLGVVS
jgi:hypothetical protein